MAKLEAIGLRDASTQEHKSITPGAQDDHIQAVPFDIRPLWPHVEAL
jgi:hypothetical protein